MTPDEFREHGHAMVEFVARYLERVEDLPVYGPATPGSTRALLPAEPPTSGEPWADIAADLERVVLPGLTGWQSPNWFAYFPANISGPSILGELAAAGLGQQGMLWATGPACTELETHVLDWLVGMLGLPAAFRSDSTGGGVIQDSASSAALSAIVAARHRLGEGDGALVAYASTQTHSSVEKDLRVAGIEHLRLIDVDDAFAMRVDDLERQVAADRAAGLRPFFVAATIGTTSSLAVDPVRAIGELCAREDLWLHVDAAMAGVAAICPEHRDLNDGLELVSSYCTDPHKWLLVNFDCTLFYVRDRAALITSQSVLPEYLRNAASASGAVIDYRDWHVPLGRRFRALKLWFVIRHYGVAGLQEFVRGHVALAAELAGWVRDDPRWELVAPPTLGLVCLRHVGGDAESQRVLEAVNASGRAALTQTRLGPHYAIRISVGAAATSRRHVVALWEQLCALA
jgi:aromatic-L-amino-acid decarboxylase